MTHSITLDPVPGMSSSWVMRGTERIAILIPPKASEPWEVWMHGEWIAHRFDTEAEALEALGILPSMELAA